MYLIYFINTLCLVFYHKYKKYIYFNVKNGIIIKFNIILKVTFDNARTTESR